MRAETEYMTGRGGGVARICGTVLSRIIGDVVKISFVRIRVELDIIIVSRQIERQDRYLISRFVFMTFLYKTFLLGVSTKSRSGFLNFILGVCVTSN